MKHYLLTLTALFFLLSAIPRGEAGAQVTLDKIYDHSASVTKINAATYKYFLMDVAKSQCRIYNTDHTLWKTISISLPANYYLYDIKFVTQDLFNADPLIELWYSAYEWVSTGTDTGYYRYLSKIINETGTEIISVTGGAYAYIVNTAENLYKLTIYAYDNSVWPGTVKTHIFSLPSTQTAAAHLAMTLTDPYPNPARESINIPLEGASAGDQLVISNVNGQIIEKRRVSGETMLTLPVRNWKPGIYTYRIVAGGIPSASRQFIIR